MSKEYRDRVALWLHDNAGNLLVQDDRDRGLGLKFPGGGIDPGQSVNDAAIREALEEVGYSLADKPRAIPGVRARKIDWDPIFSAEAAAKGRNFRGSKHYHRRALAGDRDESLLGSEGDALKANWMPIAEVLEATRSAAKNPDNKYNYFDEERLQAAEKMYEMLTQKKTASDKLFRHRATVMLRDPETGRVLAAKKQDPKSKASPYFFPGGGLYDDEYDTPRYPTEETIIEGARREALEELGLELDNPRVVGGYGQELEDWWKEKALKNRGAPYVGGQEHYVLADKGKQDDSLYNVEGDAFTSGDYHDPEEVYRALSEVAKSDSTFAPFNKEQARILKEHFMNKTSSHTSPYIQAYLAGVKLAEAQFDDYQSVSDPDGFDEVTTKSNSEDPKSFRSNSYSDRSSPATNNYSTSGRNQSTHAKQPDEVTPDQTFATNSPKRDRLRGKYNG